MIDDYRSRGLNVSRILALLKIPRSTHYYSLPSLQIRRGRKTSMITERITDSGIIAITDEQILLDITDLLGREFVCYGYKKVCKHLQRSGYIINKKRGNEYQKEIDDLKRLVGDQALVIDALKKSRQVRKG